MSHNYLNKNRTQELIKTIRGHLSDIATVLSNLASGDARDNTKAPINHTQPSSTITAMTGYSKPQATSAITASDTINQAIGKLEAAISGNTPASDRQIYGFVVDGTSMDYVADAFGKIPAHINSDGTFDWGDWADAFFIPRPCMLRYDGTVDYYLDPNDYSKKEDGTPSDINNINYPGNAMMEFPLIYFSSTSLSGNHFYVANYKVDNSYECYCNYDYEGNIIPHFYMAIYQGYGSSSTRSISGVTPSTATIANSVNRALANNTVSDVIEWYTDVFCDRHLITMLLILISKSAALGFKFGRGYLNDTLHATGLGDDKGLFYGIPNDGGSLMKVFGMENFWGNKVRYLAGYKGYGSQNSSSSVLYPYSTSFYAKSTWSTADGSSSIGYNAELNTTGMLQVASLGLYAADPKIVSSIKIGSRNMFVPSSLGSPTPASTDAVAKQRCYAYDTYVWRSKGQTGAILMGAGGYNSYYGTTSTLQRQYVYASNAYDALGSNATVSTGLSCKPHISKF